MPEINKKETRSRCIHPKNKRSYTLTQLKQLISHIQWFLGAEQVQPHSQGHSRHAQQEHLKIIVICTFQIIFYFFYPSK